MTAGAEGILTSLIPTSFIVGGVSNKSWHIVLENNNNAGYTVNKSFSLLGRA
jgi:hypothetical protein